MNSRIGFGVIGIICVTFLASAVLIIYGCRTANMEFTGTGIRITGMYGLEIPFSEVASVEMTDNIPKVKYRTNGFSAAGVDKGYYRVEGWGRTRIFSRRSYEGPYLIIYRDGDVRTVFKTRNSSEARDLYEAINNYLVDSTRD